MKLFDFLNEKVSPKELIDAAKEGDIIPVKLLLEKGANANAANII
jgi:hypothetical protein